MLYIKGQAREAQYNSSAKTINAFQGFIYRKAHEGRIQYTMKQKIFSAVSPSGGNTDDIKIRAQLGRN